jgi:hypothetical protein
MPTYQFLTDRSLAQSTAITPTTLIHIVTTADTTQSIFGSSYKAELQQLQDIFGSNPDVTVTGGTYDQNTGVVTFYNNTGGTFNVSGFITGFTDSFVSGGTYNPSTGDATFTNTTGGTFTLTGFYTGYTDTYWTSGSTGTSSIKAINSSGLDSQGDRSVAWGNGTLASGDDSTAFGVQTSATTVGSTASGYQTLASGVTSHAEGSYTVAFGDSSHSEGTGSQAIGDFSHSEGWNTIAIGSAAHAEGYSTLANGGYSHAEGGGTLASGDLSHAEGDGTTAIGIASHTEGWLTTAVGDQSHAGGYNSIASGETSFIHSYNSMVFGDRSVVIGGQGITGTSNDTVYVPYLNIKNIGSGSSVINLGLDSNNNVVTGTTGGGSFTGGTVTGETIFTGGISATTISATTIGSPTDCVDDLYVSNIHSCSPLNINPLDEGNVYFGSTSGITIDLSNERIGIGTDTPEHSLDILGTNSRLFYDPTSVGGRFTISGNTGVPRLDVITSGFGSRIGAGGALGMRTWDDTSYPGYGKVGDMFVYAGNETYGLNFINPPGTNQGTRPTEDYIRFYAGQLATGTADIHIQGSGSTKGFVGIGTETPTEKLTVNGTTSFKTSSLTTGTTPSFYYLDGVSTPTDTTTVKSVYKEFRPTTKTTTTVVGDGTLLYPNINSSSSAIFYAKANLTLYTDNLSLLTSNEALKAETNVIQIQSSSGTYSGVTMGTMSVLRNITAGGTIDKYVGFWMNGFDVNYTHNGTTNNIYGFYMDSQSGRSGNVPPTTNRYGVYIEDVGRNYFAGTVGIGTTSPSEKLEVSGKTKTTNFQMTSGGTSGFVLTSDASGNASWQSMYGYQYYSAITITSAQTLSIGSSPVEILPAPGANKYYDFKVFFEYIFNTTSYVSTGKMELHDSTTKRVSNRFDFNGQLSNNILISDMNAASELMPINSKLEFTTSDGTNPTLGDSSFKVKIYYNIIDFG